MKRAVQYFSPEYLEECKKFSSEEIIHFLEGFRQLQAEIEMAKRPSKSKLISIKIPENLLLSFRGFCKARGVPYQTQIKNLMTDWIQSGNPEPKFPQKRSLE